MSLLIHYEAFFDSLTGTRLEPHRDSLRAQLQAILDEGRHGTLPKWKRAIDSLPSYRSGTKTSFGQSTVTIGQPRDLSSDQKEDLRELLMEFIPWRKGPFSVFGIPIDTEWRSDWKWDRLKRKIRSIKGKAVLDIGCGSGYHCWRMLGAGASRVIGIDPYLVFVMQFLALNKLAGPFPIAVLPLGDQDFPSTEMFDTVFSMGVLYHQKRPEDHLAMIQDQLKPGGEMVMETLVIEDKEGPLLVPEDRYAGMRNVWSLPSVTTLELWIRRAGFRNVRKVDLTPTSTDEQRTTDWMPYESLVDRLDPRNPHRTTEGHPAPLRAIILADK